MIRRILSNRMLGILIHGDSRLSRPALAKMLRLYRGMKPNGRQDARDARSEATWLGYPVKGMTGRPSGFGGAS